MIVTEPGQPRKSDSFVILSTVTDSSYLVVDGCPDKNSLKSPLSRGKRICRFMI